ncbi:hypothetical protein FACS1894218_1790 [Bacilli bacterium]|nr:hypothetical protein FACS1894218_1790 [Bacilli bacterium]
MKKYIVKQSEYKPLEGKEIALQPVGDNTTTSDGGRYNDVKKPRKSKAPG